MENADPVIWSDFSAAFVARWKMRSHKNHLCGRGRMVPRLALAALRSGSGLDGLWLWRRHARDAAGGWSSRPYALSNPRPMVFVGTRVVRVCVCVCLCVCARIGPCIHFYHSCIPYLHSDTREQRVFFLFFIVFHTYMQIHVSNEDFWDLVAIEVANLLEQSEFSTSRFPGVC